MRLCVFEDAGVLGLYPLTQTRPAFDLWCGASSLLDRLKRFFKPDDVGALVRPSLVDLCRAVSPALAVNDPAFLRGPVLLVNARWLPLGSTAWAPPARPEVGLHGDAVAYVSLSGTEVPAGLTADLDGHLAEWKRTLPGREAGGTLVEYPWDLVEANGAALAQDYAAWKSARERKCIPGGVTVLGPWEELLIDPSATVEPLVVADTTRGPVLVDRGAVIDAFTRLEGPCYVGPETRVLGARVRGGSFGPQCRIGGEIEASIFQGYANKAHDGFVGHSYIGEWVNLAAGAQTSDLRIDYGPVSVPVGPRTVETGLLKVGSFIGDHTKTAVNIVFNTGSLIGPFAQMLPSGSMAPRVVPAFCRYGHGRLQERTDLWEMFATAATAMKRRGRPWTEALADFFHGLYEATSKERQQVIRESEQRRLRQVV